MENRFEIKPYPTFNEVFADDELKGIFYPLCTVVDKEKHKNKLFHFISSNGLWMNEDFETNVNTAQYTVFDLENDKYRFKGNLKLYNGFEQAKLIFPALEVDFEKNGVNYLKSKIKTDIYIEEKKAILDKSLIDNFDIDYYLQTFYEFSVNKLNYELNKRFGEFRKIIDGWGSHESPIVYDETSNELKNYDKPDFNGFDNFDIIGKVIGYEFFTDGNDTILFYDKTNEKVICLNSYS